MIRRVQSMSPTPVHRRLTAAVALPLAIAAITAGCSKSTTNSANTTPVPSAGSSSSAPANATLAAVYKGTMTSPSSVSRPAVKGKNIWIISGGQSSESSSVPVNAAADAARAIGWTVHIYDTQLNPANDAIGVSEAIAAHADGIILDAIDCADVKSQLEQAKAAGIATTGIYAYDCNDPYAGHSGQPLFSGVINYGAFAAKHFGAFAERYGYAEGQAAIAATNGHAKVIIFNDPTVTVLHYTGQGFLNAIKQCSGCSVVKNVTFNGLQLGPQLLQTAASAILQHPEANVVKSPFSAATLLSIGPAVAQSGRAGHLYVMGGEGFEDELNLLRNNNGVSAVMISPSDWTGWAAVDTLNSIFRGDKPAFSGLGWQLVDATHNLPASGPWVPPVDFKSVYKKAWGVG